MYPKNVFLKISTFLLLLIFVSFDKFIDHFSISFLVHFPSLYQKFLKYLYNFVFGLVTVINFFDDRIIFLIISYLL